MPILSKSFRFAMLTFAFAVSVISCKPEVEILIEEMPNVTLRIDNQTNHDINTVISNSQAFENLAVGTVSEYIGFDQIYQWPEITFQANEQSYEWTSPIDNIGFWAAKYESGAYTLTISSIDTESPFTVEAVVEED